MKNSLICLFVSLCFFTFFVSCNTPTPNISTDGNDSLYRAVNSLRFINIDTMRFMVQNIADNDKQDKNNVFLINGLAYSAMSDMDYRKAISLYDSIITHSNNVFDCLEANIGMMRLCSRISANKEFYDYRAGAMHSLRRIKEEEKDLPEFLSRRLNSLELEFNIISAIYFSGLNLYDDYNRTVNEIKNIKESVQDTAMTLYVELITASANELPATERFTTIYRGINQSTLKGYKWLSAYYKLLLAIMLRDEHKETSLLLSSSGRMARLNKDSLSPSELPGWFAEKAIEEFREYGDRYMVIKTLAVLSSCHIQQGNYEKALSAAATAIDEVNCYYDDFYDEMFAPFALFQEEDSMELKRMAKENVINIFDCMLTIRHEISCAYAGLGNREAAYMNRNSYLDILKAIRQNREMESLATNAVQNANAMLRWLVISIMILFASVVLAIMLIRKWHIRKKKYTGKLMELLALCRELTTYPLSQEFSDKEKFRRGLSLLLCDRLTVIANNIGIVSIVSKDEIGAKKEFTYDFLLEIEEYDIMRITSHSKLSREEQAFIESVVPYIRVAILETERLIEMGDERLRLEELNASYALNLTEHKKENILKRTSLSIAGGIRPYMDRIKNELEKISSRDKHDVEDLKKHLYYISELTDKIEEYNTILERWIKMRHGEFNLHVENFALQELFDIISKGTHAFGMRGQTLEVRRSDAVVKADKALTLFMINTLADNAGKFTPEGGKISIYATLGQDFAEITVEDSGIGLSDEDIQTILGEKIYDASNIGQDNGKVIEHKGYGFGLMNCKGIINKYIKTSDIFKVCRMDIKSEKGKGSRFSFRLPKGIIRSLLALCLLLPYDGIAAYSDFAYITALADSVYISNIKGDYEKTLSYAQKTIGELNRFYRDNGGVGDTISLYGKGKSAEIDWWCKGFATDTLLEEIYHNLLDVRNETAVALLNLQKWDDYRYNNNAYTTLYRLVHEDKNLGGYYQKIRRIANTRQATVALCMAIFIVLVLTCLLYYFRNCVMNRINLNTALEINKRLLQAADRRYADTSKLLSVFADKLFRAMNEAFETLSVKVAFYDNEKRFLRTATFPETSSDERLDFSMEKAFFNKTAYNSSDDKIISFPLLITSSEKQKCVGAVAFRTTESADINEKLIMEIVAGYVASAVFHATIGMEQEYRNFDELVEENKRMKLEENILHVQNSVMDNCLSMIKHETIYYPNKIKELVTRSIEKTDKEKSILLSDITDIYELMEYYSSVCQILLTCASKQSDNSVFTPTHICFNDMANECVAFVKRCAKRKKISISLSYNSTNDCFYGDKELVIFLFESIFDELTDIPLDGKLQLQTYSSEQTLIVEIHDFRRHISREEQSCLFVPSSNNLNTDNKTISGTGFLVAKEIVRIHEDYVGRYGGRMEAEDCNEGTVIRFTLPK